MAHVGRLAFMTTIGTELTEVEIAELVKQSEPARVVHDWMKIKSLQGMPIKTDGSNTFEFAGRTEHQVAFVVTQPKKYPRSIIIVSNLEFLPAHIDAMSKLPPKEKDAFLWDLKKELIFAPATFIMSPNMNDPKTIQFAKEISFDELSEGRLTEALDFVCRSVVWTIWVLIRKFGIPTESG